MKVRISFHNLNRVSTRNVLMISTLYLLEKSTLCLLALFKNPIEIETGNWKTLRIPTWNTIKISALNSLVLSEYLFRISVRIHFRIPYLDPLRISFWIFFRVASGKHGILVGFTPWIIKGFMMNHLRNSIINQVNCVSSNSFQNIIQCSSKHFCSQFSGNEPSQNQIFQDSLRESY